jgi:endonuclease-3 related protein
MLTKIYASLLKEFGRQEWWPMKRSFRPKEWEVCVGAILTQNTNWKNVERALDSMLRNNLVTPDSLLEIKNEKLEEIIRSSGFYKQKAQRLKTFSKFVLGFGSFANFKKSVERSELLKVKGIGPETCDSILLYACGRPCFVIDAYTKRFAKSLGIRRNGYESLREYFESRLPKDVELYKEFHALIVERGKRGRSGKK